MQLDENETGTWSKVLINLKVFFPPPLMTNLTFWSTQTQWMIECSCITNLKLWFRESHVEGESKHDYKQHRENDRLQKCKENLSKHYNVDADAGGLGTDDNEVNPSKEYNHYPKLPLPLLRTHAGCSEDRHKDDGEDVKGNFDPVGQVREVSFWVVIELHSLLE